jgi:2,5-furandicarboxylate decarboxylase 1
MAKDLPSFIAKEGATREGAVIREKNFIDANNYETVAYLKHLDIRNEPKMVLFENLPALNGKKSEFPMFYNPWVSRQYIADSLDMGDIKSPMEVSLEVAKLEQQQPMPMHQKGDAGPYHTMTCAMKGLNADFYDITFTKNKFHDPKHMSFSAHKHHHLEAMACEYEEKNLRAPVIVILGHHPAFYLSSCAMTAMGNNDYMTASAFLKEPLRLTPSTTWGDKFMVPADAEVIIEGEILPGVRQPQNPFGEILGYAQPKMDVPVIEVTAITHRRGGIVEDFWPGHMDHWNLGSVPKEGSTYNVIKKNIPGIKAIHLAASGCGRCICYISIKKEFENEPNKAGMQAFVEMPNLKLAVIVDDDIDVFNEREVMWAVATRVHWDKDIEIIREVQSFRGWLGDTVAIIDATIPLKMKAEWPVRNEIEPAAFERVAKFFK